MYLSGNDKVVRGKKGTAGVHIFKTTQVRQIELRILSLYCSTKNIQAVIVATYSEPIVPEQVLHGHLLTGVLTDTLFDIFQCANTTEKLGEYLISVGY